MISHTLNTSPECCAAQPENVYLMSMHIRKPILHRMRQDQVLELLQREVSSVHNLNIQAPCFSPSKCRFHHRKSHRQANIRKTNNPSPPEPPVRLPVMLSGGRSPDLQ